MHCFQDISFRFPANRPKDRAILSECPSIHYSIRPDDVPYHPDTSDTKHHSSGRRAFSVQTFTVSRSYCSSMYPFGRLSSPSRRLSVIDQIRILSKFNLREECFNRPDDVDSRPDARATNMEIADLTSTVRMPALHGPDVRIADMEIAC